MPIWKLFENAIGGAAVKEKEKEPVIVPTIVVTPVLEEDDAFDNIAAWTKKSAASTTETVSVQINSGLPTPPASPPTKIALKSCGVPSTGLGISGLPAEEIEGKADYSNPLNEVDDLLEILGLNIEEEKDEVEDEIERLLETVEVECSKLVNKSKTMFLELSREWKEIMERDYLPAKREAKLIISESYAMEQWQKSRRKGREESDKAQRDEQLFAAIVLADSAKPACKSAFEAVERIYNIQNLALTKYATRLKDHKILPLAVHRRYVRRVKRTEREMEGWLRKRGACRRILEVGERVLNEMGKEPGTPDSGYKE